MIKAACGYVTPFCCPVHAVSFSAYRCVAWAGTGNTSTSCTCSGTCTDSRGLTRCSITVLHGCSLHCPTPAMRGATTRHRHGHSVRGGVPDVVCCGWYRACCDLRCCLRARVCFYCSFQHFWMHAAYVWHPTGSGLTCCNVCMYVYSTDAHACVRVCPRFLRPLTVVDEIREAPGRYVLTPCHSLSLAHPRCVCTAMVANQHTLMHVDGEDSTNQPHAYGRIPRAASRTASRCTQRSTACVAGLPARTCHRAVLPFPRAQQAGSGAALPPPP